MSARAGSRPIPKESEESSEKNKDLKDLKVVKVVKVVKALKVIKVLKDLNFNKKLLIPLGAGEAVFCGAFAHALDAVFRLGVRREHLVD